ncbi:hypothetical protein HGRIS_008676 [Hohenbuehelia grisea]
MRSEKAWRPIVTVDVDKHVQHELRMGIDGQNPNLKSVIEIHEAHHGCKIEINVWYESQSKKKRKKRSLVATTCLSLGELAKMQGSEDKLAVPLKCLATETRTRKNSASKGRPQNGALVSLRVRSPPTLQVEHENLEEDPFSDDDSKVLSDTLTMPSSPLSDTWGDHQWPERPCDDTPARPFILDSDDEYAHEPCNDEKKRLFLDHPSHPHVVDPDDCDDPLSIKSPRDLRWSVTTDSPVQWIFASLLPRYTEKVEVPCDMNRAESVLSTFTLYRDFKAADRESHFESIQSRLRTEWQYVGASLLGIAALDIAVFAIPSDSLFHIDPIAQSAVTLSAFVSVVGITAACWHLYRFGFTDLNYFIDRARDSFESYFFFALAARVPSICLVVSSMCLLFFVARIAYQVWPLGALMTWFVFGLMMGLQSIVSWTHWGAKKVAAGGRRVARSMSMSRARVQGT